MSYAVRWITGGVLLLAAASLLPAEEPPLRQELETLLAVRGKGQGHVEAARAWQRVVRQGPETIPVLLEALDRAEPLAANWIRAAIETVAEKALREKKPLPEKQILAFLQDRRHEPRARRLAWELLARANPPLGQKLIPSFLDDPSVELRREAVSHLIGQIEQKEKAGADKQELVRLYRQALSAARDEDQVKHLADKLRSLGQKVDLARHFGYVLRWKLIGPFDNTAKKGFAVAYPPERELDFQATYPGKVGPVRWIDYTTDEPNGRVDLNKALGKHMGAVGYAATIFYADRAQEVDIRVTSDCAVKFWLNGQLLGSYEVYHAGQRTDQYIGRGRLRPGKNVILVKCCQNEQKEPWAQGWQFRLRVCDRTGTAILSTDRP